MIIQIREDINTQELNELKNILSELNIDYYPVRTQHGHYQICTPKSEFDIRRIGQLDGIKDVHRVSGKHKMVSQKLSLIHI